MSGSRCPVGERIGSRVIGHTTGPSSSSASDPLEEAPPESLPESQGSPARPPAAASGRQSWLGHAAPSRSVRVATTASAPPRLSAMTARESALEEEEEGRERRLRAFSGKRRRECTFSNFLVEG